MFDAGEDEDQFSPSDASEEPSTPSKKRKMKNKKRFTQDQIRSLESIFQNESKLEPRKKVQLAKELGLQPRQVAIWFQNKRARWKSKQLERDYGILRANYNALASKYDNLKKEKHSLLLQLQKLQQEAGDEENKKNESDHDQLNPSLQLEGSNCGADGCNTESANYFDMDREETALLTMVEPACSSLTSDEDWHELNSDGLFDHITSSCQWWDFWS